MNFNGKISEWELKVAQASGTCREYGNAIVQILGDIRGQLGDGPEDKYLSINGVGYTFATGARQNGVSVPDTATFVTEIPYGQQYELVSFQVGTLQQQSTGQLALDGKFLASAYPILSPIRVGPGILTMTALSDDMQFLVQLRQVTRNETKTNDGFAGISAPTQRNAPTLDQERHFDSNRIEVNR